MHNITAASQERIAKAKVADVNQHIYTYLDFFLTRDKNPNFAVLINGSWGIGKTFLVRRYLDEQLAGDKSKRYLYISLYGLGSAEEINDAVVEALFPMVADKTVKVAGKLAGALLKKIIDLPKIKYSDLVDQMGDMVIIFDDLERCSLDPAQVLGFINRYVEHDTCSVIVLANETEIAGSEYARVKEKVVGKTLAIVPSFSEALGAFISQIKPPELCDFLLAQTANIEAIYQTSGTQNLRILFQVLLDYERIWSAIEPDFRSNAEAMSSVLRLIAALSFELKSGGIGASDLVGRRVNWLRAFVDNSKHEPTRWQVVCRKYPTAELEGSLLSDEVLTDIFERGEVKGADINVCLARSSFFVGESEEPWRTLWNAYYRTEEKCSAALIAFQKQFSERAFVDPGIALHAFGLKLMLADMGLETADREKAVIECLAYLDDLETSGKLEPLKPDTFYSYDTGYEGLGFMERESPDFQMLLKAFTERQHRAYADAMPKAIEDLMVEMETNPDLFWRRINYNNIGDQLYADVPIFADYAPENFVDRLLALQPGIQNSVVMGLASRYDHGALDGQLAREKPWLQSVCRILKERAVAAGPFDRHRIEITLRHYLLPKAEVQVSVG